MQLTVVNVTVPAGFIRQRRADGDPGVGCV